MWYLDIEENQTLRVKTRNNTYEFTGHNECGSYRFLVKSSGTKLDDDSFVYLLGSRNRDNVSQTFATHMGELVSDYGMVILRSDGSAIETSRIQHVEILDESGHVITATIAA